MDAKKVAVIGGDRRMVEAVVHLTRRGYAVRAAGLPQEAVSEGLLSDSAETALDGADLLILPVQPVEESGKVFTQAGANPVTLTEHTLSRMRSGALVLAGLASQALRDGCKRLGLRLYEYREADEFAVWNSIPSAEGAMQMAMQATPFTIFGSKSLVIGFGRTGKAVALLLKGLNSDVTVAVRKETDYARVWSAGYRYASANQMADAVREVDLVFNTAPSLVLPRSVLQNLPKHAAVIDLAAAPGGTDFAAAAELGIYAKLAPGLPGIVAPVTAGRFIADLAVRYLQNSPADRAGEEEQ